MICYCCGNEAHMTLKVGEMEYPMCVDCAMELERAKEIIASC